MQLLRQHWSVVRQYPWQWWPLTLSGAAFGYYVQFIRNAWSVELGLIAAALWVIGASVDIVSTWLAFRLKPEYDRRGLPFPNAEICPFLPPYPTLRDLLTNKSILITMLAIPAVFLLPGAGFFGGIIHLCAAAFNGREMQRIKRGLEAWDARGPRMMQRSEGGGGMDRVRRFAPGRVPARRISF